MSTPSTATPVGSVALQARPLPFAEVPRRAWDRLLAATPAATPFSRWTFHRAWWDAYGATAHEQYLVCVPAETPATSAVDPDAVVGIAPLMHRHAIEPTDLLTATTLRRDQPPRSHVPGDAKAVFMAASYHADYATILAAPPDLPAVSDAVVRALAGPPDPAHGDRRWDVVDLRRWRDADPGLQALRRAFERHAATEGWSVVLEQEDVCPVVELGGDSWDGFLARLDRKHRHEIRRKVRRAEASGPVTFRRLPLEAASVERFIELHQARWGALGLFPPSEGGSRSRRFLHRLTELEAGEPGPARLQLGEVRVGDRVVFATVGFDDGATCYFYNAGMDPTARDLSPGVTGTAAYIRDRLEAGRQRFDFLRGNERYKYEWGGVDEPVRRLLVTRREG
jgi:CelD/BcsL family acetyltransferase involved in cellulose biosynthesis